MKSSDFKDKRILVTGGAGFIGSEIVKKLLEKNAIVTVFDNFSSGRKSNIPLKHKKLKVIKGTVENKGTISKVIKNQEIVFNLAALPFIPDSYYYPGNFFSTNTIGTVNVILGAINSKSVERFLQISTSEVYGSAQQVPMDENHPTCPFSTYAVSKLAGDRAAFTMCKEHGFPVVVLRPFNSYGPRFTQPYIIPEIMNQILNGKNEITLGNINSSRDFTYVSDTANAMLKASIENKAIGEIFNIGSNTEITIRDLVYLIAKTAKKKTKIKHDESRERPYDVMRLLADNKKAKRILKWKPKIRIEEGIKKTWSWSKKNRIEFNASFKREYLTNKN